MSIVKIKTRREFLAETGSGLVVLTLGSACGQVSPQQARAGGEALQTLSETEGRALEALGDVLLPGAAAAGIAHYVDSQLASAAPLLMLKYVDYPGPLADFYRQGLASLDEVARARHAHAFHELSAAQQSELVGEISRTTPSGWTGPPAPLFYFVSRNDAMDVYYGTPEGFARLDVPYMPHIPPEKSW